MSQTAHAPADLPVSTSLAHLRQRKLEATQALLGDTISISDEAWQEPSRQPGWTRAHVATHLARNADGLARVVDGLLAGHPTRMYASEAERRRELEQGSLRGALELQIDLDTSVGRLSDSFDRLEESGRTDDVELTAGFVLPVRWLTVARFSEVVLHHVDLDCGFGAADVDADIAHWLLQWTLLRIGDRGDFPALDVTSTSGLHARLGGPGEPQPVHGTDAALLAWLTGRQDERLAVAAGGLQLPAL